MSAPTLERAHMPGIFVCDFRYGAIKPTFSKWRPYLGRVDEFSRDEIFGIP
jgi:hypothetical protein